MRFKLETEGGVAFFPGLARPVAIDTDELSPEEAARWNELAAQAMLWECDAPPHAPTSARDQRTYTLVVEDGGKRRHMRLTDPLPAEVRPLIRELEAERKRRRTQGG
jgi:hypothetical protein